MPAAGDAAISISGVSAEREKARTVAAAPAVSVCVRERPVIAARAPLRISLGGGGTDLPSFYREEEGFVLSAAIDKHVSVLVATGLRSGLRLKHLNWEDVEHPSQVEHPILRAALAEHWNGAPLELASAGDVPPGTGLGSSGAYAVCTIRALRAAAGRDLQGQRLAEAACRLEIELLERTVGKQDQYAAVHGGINALSFHSDGSVDVRPLELPPQSADAMRERFLLFYTGGSRSASELLSDQVTRTLAGDDRVRGNLRRTAELARATCSALESGDLAACGDLMNESWENKRARSLATVPSSLADLRDRALRGGGRGAMLMGAGGGGFLLVLAEDPARLRATMAGAGAPELPFGLDFEGCVLL
jgi:D-glycero-alpha-D-manno-heptose-7-phosphate kinase